MKTSIKAVLFDYDGVIADSMEDMYLSWKRVLHTHGGNLTRNQFYPLEGKRTQEIAKDLCKRFGIPDDKYQTIVKEKDAYYANHFSFRLFPHVVSVIKKIKKQGFKTAIVTGGSLPRIQAVTPKAVMDLFDVVVTCETITRGKPYPDPYLKALELLHLTSVEAVVVENAVLGIASAKAAGLYCIALSTSVPCSELKDADMCVDGITQVPALLRSRI
jgi:beta-phosphoglucomutase